MKKIIILALILASILTSIQAEGRYTMTSTSGVTLNATAILGGLVFDELKGKIVFLEVYGYRCSYCIKAINPYNKLQEKYKEKLAIVSIEIGGLNSDQLKKFDKDHGVKFLDITKKEAGDLIPYVSQLGKFQGMVPFLLIFDKNGKLYKSKSGPISNAEIENIITELSK